MAGTNLPVVAAYRLWWQNPDDILSTELGTGTDQGPLAPAAYPFQVPSPQAGTQVIYYIELSSIGSQPYQVVLTLSQQGQLLSPGTITLAGSLDDAGNALVQGQILFAV
ncbi:MAG: hypothetical protein ACRYFX_18230 [Janthinobacterium lividum]